MEEHDDMRLTEATRQCRTDPSRQEILYFRALEDHSGRNPIDPTLQDNVLIPDIFFAFIILGEQSVYNPSKFRIDSGRTKF